MSEPKSTENEIDTNSSFTHIRDEINFVHAEAYNARKALLENHAEFTKRFEAIGDRLNRIDQFLLTHTAGREQNNNDKRQNVDGELNDKRTKDDEIIQK